MGIAVMIKTWGLRLVGAVQILLGLLYLLIPDWMLAAMGHSAVASDIHYPLGMLAARFLAYGLGLILASREPVRNAMWIRLMAAIQAIDLAVGIVYTLRGVVAIELSGFPMSNAVLIAALCLWAAAPTERRTA